MPFHSFVSKHICFLNVFTLQLVTSQQDKSWHGNVVISQYSIYCQVINSEVVLRRTDVKDSHAAQKEISRKSKIMDIQKGEDTNHSENVFRRPPPS